MAINSISDRIISRAKELGLNQTDIVKATGASKASVSNWFGGRDNPSRFIIPLSKALRCSPEWLIAGTQLDHLRPANEQINKLEKGLSYSNLTPTDEPSSLYLGHVDAWDSSTPLDEDEVELPYFMDVELAAGIGADAVSESNGPKLRFSKSTLRRCGVDENLAACVKVSGNSMEPRLYDGDVVGVNTADTSIVDGKTYAINHDGLLRVKRLYRLPGGGVRVNSMNSSEYPDETYSSYDTARIKVIGRVFWHSSIW